MAKSKRVAKTSKRDLSTDDKRFAKLAGSGKGLRSDVSARMSDDASKAKSIRGRILSRVLPILILPLLGLGAIAIAGIVLIQQRTSDAVTSAEDILNEQVVEDGVTRSSERAARELADYVIDWSGRVDRLNGRATFRESVVESSNATQALGFSSLSGDALTAALAGPETRRTQVLALTVAEELAGTDMDVQVLLVSEQGLNLGSTHDTTLDSYAEEEWFLRARDTGLSFRSFINDGEHEPSFELALWTEPPATARGGAVLRVRVPLSNVHVILDELGGDDAVDVTLIDSSSSVLIADTTIGHSDEFLYDPTRLMSPGTGLNLELFSPGVFQDDEIVTSARRVADRMDQTDIVFNWLVQTSQPLDVAGSSLTEIRQVAVDVNDQRQLLTLGVLGLLLTSLVIGFIAVRSIANQITAPVKQLSDQAQAAADHGIPAIVEAARTSEELPELDLFEVETNDELSILAHSLNTMQDAAVDLAAGQAKLRRQNVARTFVSLGRRNQNLLNRQLEFIDELEQQETDADALENLFRLDHLATRMRRNAENLLVLAGEQTPRRWAKPIAVRDVLRAAASEIADYRRVRLGDIDPATVSGNLATDLSHLIAELLENAGSFSPPNTPIEVLGQHTSTHYRLAIVDQGIGMDANALAQVNDRLKNPVDFADAPSAYLGLFVVGRLSQELGITVRLASADPTGEGRRRGTIAFIDLPVSLLSSDAATPIEIDERSADGFAKRAQATAPPAANVASDPVAPVPEVAPTPTPAVVTEEPAVTSAGFPKRRSTTAGDPQTPPSPTLGEPPAVAPSAPPVALTPSPAPVAPPTEITAAGFPKRRSTATPEDLPTSVVEDSTNAPKRDATEVSNSLRSFRAAVARGRATGPEAGEPGAPVSGAPAATTPPPEPPVPAAPAPESAPESAAGLSPPPVPNEPAGMPTPDAATPAVDSREQNDAAIDQTIEQHPHPSGSES